MGKVNEGEITACVRMGCSLQGANIIFFDSADLILSYLHCRIERGV